MMRTSWVVLVLSCTLVQASGPALEFYTYNAPTVKKGIGGCATLTPLTYYQYKGALNVTWMKDMKVIKRNSNERLTISGKSLSIKSLRPSDFASYFVKVEGRSLNIPELTIVENTNFWIIVKGCVRNEREFHPTSSQACEDLCKRVCDEGWTYVPGTENKCVKYIGEPKTWVQADGACQGMGGVLTTIANRSQNMFIGSMVTGTGAWIGLNDRRVEAHYEWNFNRKTKVTFTSWGIGEPNNYNKGCNIENCVCMRKGSGKWNDLICQAYNSYVCEVQTTYTGSKTWNCTGSKCYKYFGDYLSWHDALRSCKSIHATGQLASIYSYSQNSLVAALIDGEKGNPQHNAWIGLNDIWEAGSYSWNKYIGSPIKGSYMNWEKGEPNDKFTKPFAGKCEGEDCVQVKSTGGNATWQDLSCDTQLPYLCEKTGDRGYTIGGIIGMVIGSVILLGVVAGTAHVSYVNRKRTAVRDIIKEAYTEELSTRDNNIFSKQNMYQ